MVRFNRQLNFLDKIIFLDGTSGAGKSAINSIIPCFNNVEIPKWDHFYEHISLIHENSKLDTDSGAALIITIAENDLYESMIGRHTNFRYKDGSGVFHNPNSWEYIERIFGSDGDIIIDKINNEKRILTIGSHNLIPSISLVLHTFKEKLRIIEMIRHPSSVILFWLERNWAQRMGTDPRDFTLWIEYNEKTLPWFSAGYESDYIKMNDIERIINGINWINKKRENQLNKLNNDKDKYILTIPFEHFISEPNVYINKISHFISKEPTSKLKRFLKKARIPRTFDAETITSQTNKILKMDMNSKTNNIFKIMCDDYNEKLKKIMEN